MTDIGEMYLQALNSTLPVILLILVGIFVYWKELFKNNNYAEFTALSIKIGLPIKSIYVLSSQKLRSEDGMLVGALVASSAILAILIVPFLFLYKKEYRLLAFSSLLSITSISNMVVSAIPIFSGLYDPTEVEKNAYLQMLACFGLVLPFVYYCFELATTKTKMRPGKLILLCLWRTVKQPVIIGVIVGLIMNAIMQPLNLEYPQFLVNAFNTIGYVVAPLSLYMLGMLACKKLKAARDAKKQGLKIDDYLSRPGKIIINIFVQVMRHLVQPLLVAVFCKLFGVESEEIAELSAGICASPAAVLSVVICDEYGFGTTEAAIDSIFGVFTGFLVIPLLQIICRKLYGVE